MKRIVVLIVLLIMAVSLVFGQAATKDIATIKFKVEGNCEMCKKRIENAAYIKGVKLADWNVETKEITVTYRPSKVTEDVIMQHIAHAGHDTEKYKATDTEYKELPNCCAYKTEKCTHK